MKKSLSLCSFLIFFLALLPLSGTVTHGNLTYGKEILDSIDATGLVTLDGTTVSDLLTVKGSLQAANCQIGKLDILGSTILDNCTIYQFSTITGVFTARGSYFPRGLSICSKEIEFSACTVASLQILKNSDANEPQIVRLKNGTKIDKTITFDAGNGEVRMDSSCQVGNVTGGKIYSSDLK